MAVLKDDYQGFQILTGDDELDGEMSDQLKVTSKELKSAINAENLTDQIFGRILVNRKKTHDALMEKIPGAAKATK